jgi:group I intron endonuclease
MNYKIYALKLKNSEEIKYIGYTKKELYERLRQHKTNTIRKKYKNAFWIKKYRDDIEIVLIEEGIKTKEDICNKEIYYISYFLNKGYKLNNLTIGGDGNSMPSEATKKKISESHKGKKLTDETKSKISKGHKGKKLTDETIKNMSNCKSGIKNPFYGKKHTEETLNLLRNTKTTSKAIEVYEFTTNRYVGSYTSLTDCANKLSLSVSKISIVLSGKAKHTKGFTFKLIV